MITVVRELTEISVATRDNHICENEEGEND
jgi:hypothetical protein